MPKGVEGRQLQNAGIADQTSANLLSNAQNVYGGLEPILASQAAHPTGYTPAEKANMNTAAQQSAGGSNAGAVGGGGLYAARTRNAGAGQTAVGSSVRSAGEGLSRRAVGTEVGSADLARQNQRQALGGLGSVYGTDVSGGNAAMGLSNQALAGAEQSSADNPWLKLYLQAQKNAQAAASMAAGG